MSAHRTSITLPESLYRAAEQRMADLHYDAFSKYVAQLIREDLRTSNDERFRFTAPHSPRETSLRVAEDPTEKHAKKKSE